MSWSDEPTVHRWRVESPDLREQVRHEIERCRRNVEQGGDPQFWIKRLLAWSNELREASRTLDSQISVLRVREIVGKDGG